jgi:O-Antigen ligase
MRSVRPRLQSLDGGRVALTVVVAALIVILTLWGEHKFGLVGATAPLIVLVLILIARRPVWMVGLTVGLTILCEGPSFGISGMDELYKDLYGGIEPLDVLVTVTFFSVAFDLMRRGRQPRMPAIPGLALALVALATVSGIFVGTGAGVSVKQTLLTVHTLVELIVMALVVYNLDLDDSQLLRAIRFGLGLAVLKAIIGLIVMSLGLSVDLDNGTTITYYEPTANWVMMLAILGLVAAGLGGRTDSASYRARVLRGGRYSRPRRRDRGAHRRVRPLPLRRAEDRRGHGPPSENGRNGRWQQPTTPVLRSATPGTWTATPVPRTAARASTSARPHRRRQLGHGARLVVGVCALGLLFAALLLSYRRSFWIAAALGLLILVPLASTHKKRLMIVPSVLLVAGAIWAIGSVSFQAQSPIVQRAESISPSKIEANAEDRYRLDERANVIAEIKQQPITGLGVDVPWVAIARPLGIEHVGGRLYVHFGLLWWWLKLGVLGAAAYIALLISMAVLAFRTWRRRATPEFRYFGLASLCATAGLVAVETTASFVGVDARFSVIVGAQLGLLAVLARGDAPVSPRSARDAGSAPSTTGVAGGRARERAGV